MFPQVHSDGSTLWFTVRRLGPMIDLNIESKRPSGLDLRQRRDISQLPGSEITGQQSGLSATCTKAR